MMYPQTQAPARHQGYNRMPMEIKGNKGENQLAVGFQETGSLRESAASSDQDDPQNYTTYGGRECDAPEVVWNISAIHIFNV